MGLVQVHADGIGGVAAPALRQMQTALQPLLAVEAVFGLYMEGLRLPLPDIQLSVIFYTDIHEAVGPADAHRGHGYLPGEILPVEYAGLGDGIGDALHRVEGDGAGFVQVEMSLQEGGHQPDDSGGEGADGLGHVQAGLGAVDGHGLDLVAYGLQPFLIDGSGAADDAQQRSQSARGAVPVLAAACGDADAPGEIPLPVHPTQRHDADIAGGVIAQITYGNVFLRFLVPVAVEHAEGAREFLQDGLAGGFPVHALLMAFQGGPHRPCHGAVLRDIREGRVYERMHVLLHESSTLEGGTEDLAVHALPRMVAYGVLIGVSHGNLRVPRGQAGPDLAADEAAAAILVVVPVPAGDGGHQAVAQIVLPRAVLRPVRHDVGEPVLPQDLRVHAAAVLLRRVQPHQLQIQIVIGQHAQGQVVGVIVDVIDPADALKGRAQGPSDVLAQKTGLYLVAVFLER